MFFVVCLLGVVRLRFGIVPFRCLKPKEGVLFGALSSLGVLVICLRLSIEFLLFSSRIFPGFSFCFYFWGAATNGAFLVLLQAVCFLKALSKNFLEILSENYETFRVSQFFYTKPSLKH